MALTRATNTQTGVTRDFSPYEWSLMQDWHNSPWQKLPAKAPKEAVKAAEKAGEGHEIKDANDIVL